MKIISILAVLVFGTVLCIIEIPKMLQQGLYKELGAFSVFLVIGIVCSILKTLDVQLPNPSDFIAWVYSPFQNVIKVLLK